MKRAFTLVELAISLVVISILISTILYSTSFRRAAESRATMKQFMDYQMAYRNFSDRYESRPGDFNRAYEFWPEECSSSSFCDGDDNGLIDSYKEAHLSWLHLASSRFLYGNFSGEGYGDEQTQKAGYNAPEGDLQGTQFSIKYFDLDAFPALHYLLLGGESEADLGIAAIITPHNAYQIDSKMDDGTPLGKLLGRNGYLNGSWDAAECMVDSADNHLANTDDLSDAEYYQNQGDTKACILALELE